MGSQDAGRPPVPSVHTLRRMQYCVLEASSLCLVHILSPDRERDQPNVVWATSAAKDARKDQNLLGETEKQLTLFITS